MKTKLMKLATLLMVAALPSIGCKSNQQDGQSNLLPQERSPEPVTLAEVAPSTASPDSISAAEWAEFKKSSETAIHNNDLLIKDLKQKMKTSGKSMDSLYVDRINMLEKSNKKMELRISEYEKKQSNWESFKREFNHDMDELGKAIKDLTVNNKD